MVVVGCVILGAWSSSVQVNTDILHVLNSHCRHHTVHKIIQLNFFQLSATSHFSAHLTNCVEDPKIADNVRTFIFRETHLTGLSCQEHVWYMVPRVQQKVGDSKQHKADVSEV